WSMPSPQTLEAQVTRFADRIAYLSHDIDDAIRAGVLTTADLPEQTNHVLGVTSSSRIDTMVGSLVEASKELEVIDMTPEVFDVMALTRRFMFERVYNRPESRAEHEQVTRLLEELLDHFRRFPEELPVDELGVDYFETRLVDYVSGMTDRFAQREHARLVVGA
ncbi:MAG: deoxyguanosinetriphosphate triphosphohydrolase, partial [Actinobacteria bacterium]|nr:deoxyguanosinetriphosphate triphosphohydrolase [Actinomycetota bacterium]